MKLAPLAIAAALAMAGLSAPAFAQVSVGATIYGPDGAAVGTVESVDGDIAVVNTGNVTANLPTSVFGEGENGPTIGWNKADLEAAVNAANEEAAAALTAALTEGADLYSVDGVLLGKIESIGEDGLVIVALDSGPIALPKDQMAMQADKLTFLATAADVEAAVEAQTGG